MALSNAKMQCFGCGKSMEKAQMFSTLDSSREMRFQCSGCYKHNKTDFMGEKKAVAAPTKKEFFCGRCRYKFKAKSTLCPYCSKEDQVVEQLHSVKDFL